MWSVLTSPTYKKCPWFCPQHDRQGAAWDADCIWTHEHAVQTSQNSNEKFSVTFKKYLKNNKYAANMLLAYYTFCECTQYVSSDHGGKEHCTNAEQTLNFFLRNIKFFA